MDSFSFRLDVLSSSISCKLSLSGFTVATLYGEIGGTVLFQCHSSMKEIPIKSVSFQLEGKDKKQELIIGYDALTNKTDRRRSPTQPYLTYFNHTDNTVTLRNLSISDKGDYKCVIIYVNVPGGETDDTPTTLIIIGRPAFTHSRSQQEHW